MPALAQAPSSPTRTLNFQHFLYPGEQLDRKIFQPFAKRLEKATNGRLTINVAGRGKLDVNPVTQHARVLAGEVDIVFGLPGYTPKRFMRTLLLSAPGLFRSGPAGTRTIWSHLSAVETDFLDVKLLALWVNDPPILVTRDKPVRRFEDIKGLRILAGDGGLALILEAWGAIPVLGNIGQVRSALASGKVDGALINGTPVRRAKLHQVARYYTLNMPGPVTAFYIVMNKSTWESLSDDERTAIDKMTGAALSVQAALLLRSASLMGIDILGRTDSVEITLAPSEISKFQAASRTLIRRLTETADKAGINSAKFFSNFPPVNK